MLEPHNPDFLVLFDHAHPVGHDLELDPGVETLDLCACLLDLMALAELTLLVLSESSLVLIAGLCLYLDSLGLVVWSCDLDLVVSQQWDPVPVQVQFVVAFVALLHWDFDSYLAGFANSSAGMVLR